MKKNEEKFATGDLSFRLKAAGFDVESLGCYQKSTMLGISWFTMEYNNTSKYPWVNHNDGGPEDNKCSAPLYQDIVDWFMDTHHISVSANYSVDGNYYRGYIGRLLDGSYWEDLEFDRSHTKHCRSQRDAMESAITKALELIDK